MNSKKVEYLRFDDLNTGVLQRDRKYLILIDDDPAKEVSTSVDHLSLLRQLSSLYTKRNTHTDNYLKNTIGILYENVDKLKQNLEKKENLTEEERNDIISKIKNVALSLDRFHFLFSKEDELNENINQEIEEKYKALSNHLSTLFDTKKIIPNTKSPIQIDLVLNASELGLLPYELLLNNNNGVPYFADPDRKIVLTRRIRQKKLGRKIDWLHQPKVLFIYSNPNFNPDSYYKVPHESHEESIKEALKQTIVGNIDNHLTVLKDEKSSLKNIERCLKEAEKNGEPYTHVHLLAHGDYRRNGVSFMDAEYGVALWSETKEVTSVLEFKELFESIESKPLIVSYMVCRSGAFANPIKVEKNIVQATHQVGVPIVIGSQFPLSFPGSNLITDILYKNILAGIDIREALHQIRCELYKKREATLHDWLGLVAYVSLPEGYETFLKESQIYINLQQMKCIKKSTDIILESGTYNSQIHEKFDSDLESSLKRLRKTFDNLEKYTTKKDVYEENAGLIGSAYKRRAELISFRRRTNPLPAKENEKEFRKEKRFLRQALSWYRKAFEYNASLHWPAVQFISLDRVLNTNSVEGSYWQNAFKHAGKEAEMKDSFWAYGSLAELYLLKSKTGKSNKTRAIQHTKILIDKFKTSPEKDTFFLESTRDQFKRYIHWWIPENGYNDQSKMPDKETVAILVDLLEKALKEIEG